MGSTSLALFSDNKTIDDKVGILVTGELPKEGCHNRIQVLRQLLPRYKALRPWRVDSPAELANPNSAPLRLLKEAAENMLLDLGRTEEVKE